MGPAAIHPFSQLLTCKSDLMADKNKAARNQVENTESKLKWQNERSRPLQRQIRRNLRRYNTSMRCWQALTRSVRQVPTKIVITNLAPDVTAENIRSLLMLHGQVLSLTIHRDDGEKAISAEVVFATETAATSALRCFDGISFRGKKMNVRYADDFVDGSTDTEVETP
ncbi:hypothetical protein Aperf_G00000106891 [Anoplocephala perfoliata]